MKYYDWSGLAATPGDIILIVSILAPPEVNPKSLKMTRERQWKILKTMEINNDGLAYYEGEEIFLPLRHINSDEEVLCIDGISSNQVDFERLRYGSSLLP